jgi:cytochrome c-type biogenesis protein CcmH/NrfG
LARTRYRTDRLVVRHAHGYAIQTLADLGLIGLGLSLFAAIAWMCAAARATGLRPRDRGLPFDPERIGLLTLATVVLIFGLHSLIDWTWFVPGNAVVALLAAGWVSGRPALRERDAVAATARPARRRRPGPLAGGAAAAVLIAAVAVSWAALQPVRSARSDDRAQDAAENGKYDLASSRAKAAQRQDPLSLEPLWLLAFIADAEGKPKAAARYLERAVEKQPANAEAWRRLGRYRLTVLGDAEGAVRAFRATYFLDPASDASASDLIEATRVLRAKK